MGKHQTVDLTRALGVITVFLKKVEKNIRLAGGTDEDIDNLAKAESDYAIQKFAHLLMNPDPADCQSFEDQYKFGKFDHFYGRAPRLSEIIKSGQAFCKIQVPAQVERLSEVVNPSQALSRFGSSPFRLCGLLDLVIRSQQLHYTSGPFATVWQDVESEFIWVAAVDAQWSSNKNKYLKILHVHRMGEDYPPQLPIHTGWVIL